MSAASAVVQEFFDQYARSRSALDTALIASQYPDAFMMAGPAGVRVAEKASVLAALAKGQELLKALGHKSTIIRALDETRLDDRYTLVRAQFVWRFERQAMQPIDVTLDSTFVLYGNQGAFAIVFQHEREDFQATLRAHGVLR
jgi:hypothetical protein